MTELAAMPRYEAYKDSGSKWLGDIPEHWEVKPLKFLARINNGLDYKHVLAEEGYPVYGSGGAFAFSEDYLYEGEAVLLGRKGTVDKPLYVDGKFWAVDTMFYAVCREKADTKFIYYSSTRIPFDFYSTSTALPSMTQTDLNNHLMAYPPISEREAIAAYLDTKTSQIDQAVASKEQQIELLKERRQILIQNAVTRGLDPQASMRDSGVEWIGEIPAHWEVRRSKFLFTQRTQRASPSDQQLSATQAYGVIPQEEYERMVGRKMTKLMFHLEKRRRVEIDDFVISMRSFQGGLERAWASGGIRSSYVVLKSLQQIDPDFYGYLLKIPRYIEALQATGNFIRDGQDLNFENFSKVDLFIPPLDEQKNIAAHIKRQAVTIDKAIALQQQQIDKLKEYRATLINSAVTGKIKVV